MRLPTIPVILALFPGLLSTCLAAPAASSGAAPSRAVPGRVSFLYDIHPILSRAGCNQGTCHGNANGKGGLKLSLRGADPDQDYFNLVAEGLGRRTNRAAPARSLMLRKPTAAIPHGGGQRFRTDSREYALVMRWIREGARSDVSTAPKLTALEVTPAERVVTAPVTRQPLLVGARFADGTVRDVTRDAVYEPSDPAIHVTPDGVAEAPRTGGEAGILVRWASRMETSHLTFVPARAEADFSSFAVRNLVDEAVQAKLRTVRVTPSAPADDATFVRRAYLDALGVLPTATETREFLQDRRPDKRDRLVDALLERPEFDDFWAMKWADLLRAEERSLDPEGMQAFYTWLRGVVHERVRLDQFVRDLLTATGSTYFNPAANYYRRSRDPEELAEVTAQLFMGVRLRCAKCHNHPYDVWKQDEYYSMASFFARVNREDKSKPRRQRFDAHEWNGEEFIVVSQSGEVTNPRTGAEMTPSMMGRPLVNTKAADQGDRRVALAAWLVQPSNPFFAPAMVNRIWYHMMGRGIVEPVDDFRPSNPPSNAPLLSALTRDFVANGYDLRHTVGLIMKSSTYQLSEVPNAVNAKDERYFSHALTRRLTAEQLLDGVSQATGVPEPFEGYPSGTRVTQVVPTWQVDPFLRLFGQPPRETVCECERTNETTLGQSFELISGRRIDTKLRDPSGRVAKMVADHKANGEIITEIYLAALNRYPTIQELNAASRYVTGKPDRRRALEDVLWATLNTKEFLIRR